MAKLSIKDFKRGNYLLLVVVAFATLMFVFIPEFIGIGSGSSQNAGQFNFDLTKAPVVSKETVLQKAGRSGDAKLALEASVKNKDPLDQVEYMIDQGYIEYLVDNREKQIMAEKEAREQKQAGVPAVVPAEEDPRAALKTSTMLNKKSSPPGDCSAAVAEQAAINSDPRTKPLDFIPLNKISWTNLRSRDARRALLETSRRSTVMLQKIPADKDNTRYALLNYISGIDKVAEGAEQAMTAPEAVAYLEKLDLGVTRTMLDDQISRDILMDWSKISLTPILGTRRAERTKERAVPKFNPHTTVTDALIMRQGGHSREFDNTAPLTVDFTLKFEGAEIKKAWILRNNVPFKNLFLTPGLNPGEFTAAVKYLRSGEYAVVVQDKNMQTAVTMFSISRLDLQRGWKYDYASNIYYVDFPYDPKRKVQKADLVFRAGARNTENGYSLTSFSGATSLYNKF